MPTFLPPQSSCHATADLGPKTVVRLRSDTVIEPLVCGWYAWTHLLTPVQHSLNVLYRHIPLLQSFVQSPAIHEVAAADPTMFGGPFVDLTNADVPRVAQLLADTRERCADLIRLAESVRGLDMELQDTARGFSMSQFYERIPEPLAGLVEFLYDINCHPRLRFYEELLHHTGIGLNAQEILLARPRDGARKFFMSTPRLQDSQNLILPMPFTDKRIDRLASLRNQSAPLGEIAGAMGLGPDREEDLRRFLTTDPVVRNVPEYRGAGVRVRYFGHACVLVQIAGISILIDPMVAWGDDRGDGRFTFHDLPDQIDFVVLSHNHQDHCVPELLMQLRTRIGRVLVPRNNSGNIADPSMKLALTRLGVERVETLDAFDCVSFPGGDITSLPFPGEHVDLDIHTRQGLLLSVLGRRLAFLVDSDGRDPRLYRRILAKTGAQVDALFIGMECHGAPLSWLYGPLLTKSFPRRNDDSRRLSGLDSERAWGVVQEFRTPSVFVYAMGQEPWLRFIMGLEYTPESIQVKEMTKLIDRCQAAGIHTLNLNIAYEMEL